MITSKEHGKLCDLVLEYQKTIIALHTATRQALATAAYKFGHADRALFGYILELTETSVTDEPKGSVKRSSGWIEWRGGECPLNAGDLVDVKWLDGSVSFTRTVGDVEWSGLGKSRSITAYRIV